MKTKLPVYTINPFTTLYSGLRENDINAFKWFLFLWLSLYNFYEILIYSE